MPNGRLPKLPLPSLLKFPIAAALAVMMSGQAAAQETPSLEDLLAAVVRIKAYIHPDGRTVQGLGREREGSGIVIDQNGLILTIGYLMVEAHSAEVTTNAGRTVPASVVGYDHETGFGLLRTIEPLRLKPIALGKSAELKDKDPVMIASFGGPTMAAPAFVVVKREFAGNWEYLINDAIFTAPPHPQWSGAALLNQKGRLVGVGSLIVGDATGKNTHFPGNMFVPIDMLPPILGDLITDGRPAGPMQPWLGLNTDELGGRLFVSRVTPDGPAEKAGLKRGDVIVGVKGQSPSNLGDFYRKLWAQGKAGATIRLEVLQDNEMKRIDIKSIDRLDHLKLKSTF